MEAANFAFNMLCIFMLVKIVCVGSPSSACCVAFDYMTSLPYECPEHTVGQAKQRVSFTAVSCMLLLHDANR